jgi:glycosyltransferase involved in cell wall biosynthesis
MHSVTNQESTLPMGPYLNKMKPWVTVICTCFNHEKYVETALHSVVNQHYPNVQLIVIDNASSDQSVNHIQAFLQQHPSVTFIQNPLNVGLCRAFNQGLKRASGQYVIDLSADDVLLPDRLGRQVERFEQLPPDYAVVFTNAAYIDANGQFLEYHYPVNDLGESLEAIPSGYVFKKILEKYYICTPTMMMRRSVLDELGGYDESLDYEDFDFWVRSARHYAYAYIDEVLTHKRRLPNSMSMQVIEPHNRLLASTLNVCYKAFDRCQTPDEYHALAGRVRQFLRKSFYAEQFELTEKFGDLLSHIESPGLLTAAVLLLNRLHLPVNALYRRYSQLRHKQWNPI